MSEWFNRQKHHRSMKEVDGVVSEDTTEVLYVNAVEPIVSSAAEAIVHNTNDSVTINGVTTIKPQPSWGMTI